MTRLFVTASRSLAAGAASLLVSAVAAADPLLSQAAQIFDYRIVHSAYGDIGSYRNTIESRGDAVTVRSTLDIAVRFLGIPVYRETGERFERWHRDRLVEFQSVTRKNGRTLEVTGQARDDVFVVTGPAGTTEAPKDVRPSNPWTAKMLAADTIMSTSTGRVYPARVTGGIENTVVLNGESRKLRQFEVISDKPEFLWLDDRDTPVAFGTEHDGSRVEFVLTRISHGEDGRTQRIDKLPLTAANDP